MAPKTSELPKFRTLTPAARRKLLATLLDIDPAELASALASGGLDEPTANMMVENAIGVLGIPFGVGLNMRIDGVDRLVPMAIEEPSVVAAASHAAKRVRASGGFTAQVSPSLTATQIEVHGVEDPKAAVAAILGAREELLAAADAAVPNLVERGGGARDLEARSIGDGFVVAHVIVDCCDAMGANLVNTVAEALGRRVAELARGELGLRILSNYCDRRIVVVRARVAVEQFGCARADGPTAALGVVRASRFAELDPYRAVTHNKGVMNGVDAVVIATGNDFRAVEAAAHAYAARSGVYRPLSTWSLAPDDAGRKDAMLEGRLEMPLAVGTVGGALRAHRGARLALALAGTKRAADLAALAAATGLATNLAALRALATEGIQRGHMALHRRASNPEELGGYAREARSAPPGERSSLGEGEGEEADETAGAAALQ